MGRPHLGTYRYGMVLRCRLVLRDAHMFRVHAVHDLRGLVAASRRPVPSPSPSPSPPSSPLFICACTAVGWLDILMHAC